MQAELSKFYPIMWQNKTSNQNQSEKIKKDDLVNQRNN